MKEISINTKEVVWKDIPGYEGYYQASNTGFIQSLSRTVQRGDFTYNVKGRIRKPQLDNDGYLRVTLSKDRACKLVQIHRLVALAWLPNHQNKPCVNHLNSNRTDNRAENLEWCTHSENTMHGRIKGHIGPDAYNKGKWNNPVTCGTCGTLIRRKKATTKFCSRECYGKHKSKLYADAQNIH